MTPSTPCQGSSVEWCSVSKTTTSVPRGRLRASRFIESVVLRVKTTVVVIAGTDEAGDLLAGLLVPRAGDAAGVPVAAVHRGVGVQGGVDGGLDADQGRGGGGVVEVGVVDLAGERRDPKAGADDGRQDDAGATSGPRRPRRSATSPSRTTCSRWTGRQGMAGAVRALR